MVLPVMDGVATVRAIVAEFPSATIVMCASTGQPGTLVEALRAGAKSYVTKPFHGTQLIDVISKVLVA
jgi:two-component system chemotaxis response regulator CheY